MNEFTNLRNGIVHILVAAIVLSACAQRDPLDLKVDSSSDVSFEMWRSNAADRLSPQQLHDFDEALQEIKFEKMVRSDNLRSEGSEALAFEAVNGRSVRKVLEMGFDWELQTLEGERNERLKSMHINEHLKTKPGDIESQRYLSELRDRQSAKLEENALEITRVKGRLAAYGLPEAIPERTSLPVDTPLDPRSEDERPVRLP